MSTAKKLRVIIIEDNLLVSEMFKNFCKVLVVMCAHFKTLQLQPALFPGTLSVVVQWTPHVQMS